MFTHPRWPEIRTALLTLVLLSQALIGLPRPQVLTHKSLQRPIARTELAGWTQGLQRVGLPVTEEQLARAAIDFSVTGSAIAKAAERPFKSPKRWLGIDQAWALFAAPDTWPSRLVLSAQGPNGQWDVVYAPLDAQRDLLQPALRFRRVRGVHDGLTSRSRVQEAMVNWLCRQVMLHDSRWTAVRVEIVQMETPLPGQAPGARSRVRLHKVRTRAQVGL